MFIHTRAIALGGASPGVAHFETRQGFDELGVLVLSLSVPSLRVVIRRAF